jgi:hypothetical protein
MVKKGTLDIVTKGHKEHSDFLNWACVFSLTASAYDFDQPLLGMDKQQTQAGKPALRQTRKSALRKRERRL